MKVVLILKGIRFIMNAVGYKAIYTLNTLPHYLNIEEFDEENLVILN